jgi:hypothetical protein
MSDVFATPYPERVRFPSPGLPRSGYPGSAAINLIYPERVAQMWVKRLCNPFRVGDDFMICIPG